MGKKLGALGQQTEKCYFHVIFNVIFDDIFDVIFTLFLTLLLTLFSTLFYSNLIHVITSLQAK